MVDPKTFHFQLPRYEGPPLPEPPRAWYPGVQQHISKSTSDRAFRSDGRVRAIVIHATAGATSAGAMSVMFEHRASFHWLVPGEKDTQHGKFVWACAPEARAAWHVRNDRSHPDINNGSQNVNYWSLGIEVVNTQQNNDPFSDWQVEQTAALVRYAWSKYPDLRDVVSHAKLDPARRSDPGSHFPWDRFQELVLSSTFHSPLSEDVTDTPAEPKTPRVVGLDGNPINCDATLLDGVTIVEARPLIEALGFRVEYDAQTLTMKILTKN
ncbi:MAG: N-acetylmuramoyl-L-alanine amidase [Acidobacteriota bacterium]